LHHKSLRTELSTENVVSAEARFVEIRVPGAGWLRLRNATRVGRVINENEPALVFISFFSQVLIVLFNERNAVRLQNLVLDVVFPLSHNKESKQRSWVRVTTYSYLT